MKTPLPTYSDYIVFVDESGDHELSKIDEQFPVFCLAFCVIKKSDYIETIGPALQKLKIDFWGHDHVILHEHDIRKEKGPFSLLRTNPELRQSFYDRLNAIMENSTYHIISTVIDKRKLIQKYPTPYNPYEIAVKFCMEDLQLFLKAKKELGTTVPILFEARGQREDNTLELEFRRICDNESNWGYKEIDFKSFNYDLIFAQKSLNLNGLQLADMIARPLAIQYLNPEQPNRSYEILKGKTWRKIFP